MEVTDIALRWVTAAVLIIPQEPLLFLEDPAPLLHCVSNDFKWDMITCA